MKSRRTRRAASPETSSGFSKFFGSLLTQGDLSRLGREYIETGRYLRRVFPAYGVRFIAITDNIDTAHENSGDDLTVSVKNIMNEAYCRGHFHQNPYLFGYKAAERRFCWGFPCLRLYEVRGKQNLLVPDPYAARVVQDIFRMRLDGTSALRIATTLNDMGVLSPLAYKKNNGFPYAKHGYTDKEDCKWSATNGYPHFAGRNLYWHAGTGKTGYAAL